MAPQSKGLTPDELQPPQPYDGARRERIEELAVLLQGRMQYAHLENVPTERLLDVDHVWVGQGWMTLGDKSMRSPVGHFEERVSLVPRVNLDDLR